MDNVVVLYGNEPYTIKQYVDTLRMNFEEFCISYYDEWKEDMWPVARQVPMFCSQQLLLVKPKTLSDDNFIEYCKNPSSSTVMVVVPETVDKRTKAFKKLQSLNVLKECKKLSEGQMQKFVISEIQGNGSKIRESVYEYFIQKTGYFLDEDINLFSIRNYIAQLCDVSDGEITRSDVDAFVVETCTTKTFALTNLLLKKDRAEIFRLSEQFLREKENVIGMLSLLLRTFRLGYKASLYSDKNEAEIAKLLGVPAFQFKDALRYPPNVISDCMDVIGQGIQRIKFGQADDRSALFVTLSKVLLCLED